MSKEIEGMNRVIAEFMEFKSPKGYENFFIGKEESLFIDQFKYHESYDWLMPVWGKFRDLEFPVELAKWEYHHSCMKDRIGKTILQGTIGQAHELLNEAIEWYNNIK